jgi:hypothetical protein
MAQQAALMRPTGIENFGFFALYSGKSIIKSKGGEGFRAGLLEKRVIPTFESIFFRRIFCRNGVPIVFGEEPNFVL